MKMEKIKIAAPLYILRNEAEQDLFAVLEKLKAIGFEGVELLGFFGKKPEEIKAKLDELSMEAVGNHVPSNEFIKNPDKVIRDHLTIGCRYITIAWPDRAIAPGTPEFDQTISDIKVIAGRCKEAGITPLYHNHDFEYRVSPSIADVVMESCKAEGICMEPDLGWMLFAQADPAEALARYSYRCPVIHFKDIYAKDLSLVGKSEELGEAKARPEKGYFEFRPVGYGMLNIPKLMPLCLACKPEWFVVDHDLAYERDSYQDLKISVDYLKALMGICE